MFQPSSLGYWSFTVNACLVLLNYLVYILRCCLIAVGEVPVSHPSFDCKTETLYYFIVKATPRVPLMFHELKNIEHESFDFLLLLLLLLLLSFFLSFFSFTHNSKTIRHIWVFHIPNATVLLEMFLFRFRPVCVLRLTSYGPNYATWSLSDTPFYVYFYE